MNQPVTLPENLAQRYGPWALIAGGSEGTGEAFARLLAAQGINLILLARRAEPLERLRTSITSEHGVDVVTHAMDLTSIDASTTIEQLAKNKEVGLFIYNLGSNIHYDRFTDWPAEKLEAMTRMNCVMPVRLAHHFAKAMQPRGRGGLIFLGSMASMAGSAYMSVYPASKAYLHILAEGLWHDLMPFGIDVMCSILGATKTPSHANMAFDELKNEAQPGLDMAMECDDVALETMLQLGRVPSWVVGEHNRALLPPDFLASRPMLVEMMSMNTANIAGFEHTPLPAQYLTAEAVANDTPQTSE